MGVDDLRLVTCGCCEPPAPATPLAVWNRPSLDRVDYRVGTYASFRQAMLQRVHAVATQLAIDQALAVPPLEGWTSRDSDDYGVAILEMWATIADILTFYSERYVSEAWLRTATSRDSIRRLAGLLGYRLDPGVAAATHVAYRLDDDVALALPAGLRVQSTPADGEQPQVFETSGPLDAVGVFNRSPVFDEPRLVDALSAGSTREMLDPGSVVPLPDEPVVLFTDTASAFEHRRVARVETVDERPVIHWSAPLTSSHAEAHVLGRSFRLFGHSAPTSHLVATPQGDPAVSVTWSQADTVFDEVTSIIELDGTVDGLEAGADVVVVTATATFRRTIEAVDHARGVVRDSTGHEVQAGAATRVTLGGAPIAVHRAETRVHELVAQLGLTGWEIPAAPIPAGVTRIYLPLRRVADVAQGRVLLLDDVRADPMLAVVAEDGVLFAIGGSDEYLEVALEHPTSRDLDPDSAYVLGNVVAVTHGASVAGEIVGDGDASQTLQSFTLAKSPVTHTADSAAPGGASSTLDIAVDRVRWSERPQLYGAGPSDRIYTTWIDDDATMHVRFGDGATGARLPTGRANVVATYRQGLGVAGNLAAGQLATALDKPTGVAGVTGPLAATGGVDPETSTAARANAPTTVRTFDRAVSLRDFADLAREYVGVHKAFATWVWDRQERVVHVTLGGEDGAELSAEQLTGVRAFLDVRRDPNRALRVAGYREVPFVVAVSVEAEPDRLADDVFDAVRANVEAYFAYDHRGFGQAVHLSDLYAVVHDAPGVASALVTRLGYQRRLDRLTHSGFGAVLVHAPVFGARPRPDGSVAPAELARLDPSADLSVTVIGGVAS